MDFTMDYNDAGESKEFVLVSRSKDTQKPCCERCVHHLDTIRILNSQVEQLTIIVKGLQQANASLISQTGAYQQHVVRGLAKPPQAKEQQVGGSVGGLDSNIVRRIIISPNSPSAVTKKPVKISEDRKIHVRPPTAKFPPITRLAKHMDGKVMTSRVVMASPRKISLATELLADCNAATCALEEKEPEVKEEWGSFNSIEDLPGSVEQIRVRMTASLPPKIRCPLPECNDRNFFAADTYHFRRHFLQVHKLCHPNPEFIFLCPVATCGMEFVNAFTNAKDHWKKEHPETHRDSGLLQKEMGSRKEEEELSSRESTCEV